MCDYVALRSASSLRCYGTTVVRAVTALRWYALLRHYGGTRCYGTTVVRAVTALRWYALLRHYGGTRCYGTTVVPGEEGHIGTAMPVMDSPEGALLTRSLTGGHQREGKGGDVSLKLTVGPVHSAWWTATDRLTPSLLGLG